MGTGLVLSGQRIAFRALDIVNWHDDRALRLGPGDLRPRKPDETWVRSIILHTSRGIPGGADQRPQEIRPGFGPGGDRAGRLVRYWTREARGAGAHLIVDFDGRVSCCADLGTEATYHAKAANGVSVGIEIVQGADAELYEGQLEVAVRLCDALTRTLGIQRQIPDRYVGPVRRLMSSMHDVVGVLGHRDVDHRRGLGDPGNAVFNRLAAAGYEPVNYELREDLEVWRRRQRDLGAIKADGVPGRKTAERLRELGRPWGMWVARPIDTEPDVRLEA